MNDTFYLKTGDTDPAMLYDLPPGIDLTGATAVVFNMRLRGTATAKISKAAATIVSASGPATLRYDWAPGDVDTNGDFEAEFEVTRADGSIATFPNYGFIDVQIWGDIA